MSNTKKAKSSTAQNWNIKGIEPETRAKVTRAAKKSGVTIGGYVNRALLDAATNDLSSKKKAEVPAKMEDVQDQIATLTELVTQMADKMNEPRKSLIERIFK